MFTTHVHCENFHLHVLGGVDQEIDEVTVSIQFVYRPGKAPDWHDPVGWPGEVDVCHVKQVGGRPIDRDYVSLRRVVRTWVEGEGLDALCAVAERQLSEREAV